MHHVFNSVFNRSLLVRWRLPRQLVLASTNRIFLGAFVPYGQMDLLLPYLGLTPSGVTATMGRRRERKHLKVTSAVMSLLLQQSDWPGDRWALWHHQVYHKGQDFVRQDWQVLVRPGDGQQPLILDFNKEFGNPRVDKREKSHQYKSQRGTRENEPNQPIQNPIIVDSYQHFDWKRPSRLRPSIKPTLSSPPLNYV